jgi:mono/diheme cytochrome c family protein
MVVRSASFRLVLTKVKQMIGKFVAAGVLLLSSAASAETPQERGGYLVNAVAACGNCHTPLGPTGPVPGQELAGRLVEKGEPFDAYAPNISQDKDTGIGKWTDDQIIKAVREGVRPDGSIIGPPMSIGLYRGLSDTDVKAMVAYLRTVKPIKNVMPKSVYRIPLPPSYGPPVGHVPDVPQGVTVEYGAYLAGPMAHCVECHSTPGPNGAPDLKNALAAGGMKFEGPWGVSVAPNLTPHEDGIRDLTDAQVAKIITAGIRPDGSQMFPPMGFGFYAHMKPDDVSAIIKYLRSIPALPDPK